MAMAGADDEPMEAWEPMEPWQEALVTELRAFGRRADPVPSEVLFQARGSLAWRRVDAELAELLFDSLLSDELAAGVRGPGDGTRLISFEAGDLSIELEISETGSQRRMIGQIVPPQVATIELRSSSQIQEVDSDELGRFGLDRIAPGPVSLRCRLVAGDRTIETGWVVV
jgi:hypothetical protein